MSPTQTRAPDETSARRLRLHRLSHALDRLNCPAQMIHDGDGPWALRVGTQTIFCAGAEGVYAYVTSLGQILSPADDAGIMTTASRLAGDELR